MHIFPKCYRHKRGYSKLFLSSFLTAGYAAKALNVHRNTVALWFEELQEHGFIHMTCGPHTGPSGIGQASKWAVDELPTDDMKPARKAFARWIDKQTPRTKIVPPRHKKEDTPMPESRENAQPSQRM